MNVKKLLDVNAYKKKISLPVERINSHKSVDILINIEKNQIDMTQYQRIALLKILKHAYIHCPYYKQLFDSHKIDTENFKNFTSIPILNKFIIRDNKNSILANNINSYNHHIAMTSGSTGNPLEFPRNHYLSFLEHAHYEYSYIKMGYKSGDKIAAFGGWKIDENKREKGIYWNSSSTGKSFPYGDILYSSMYVTNETIPLYIESILQTKPSILRGYPSFIHRLSQYILSNNINISFHIKGIQLNGEMAYENQKFMISETFKAPIYNQYGHTESAIFALTEADGDIFTCSPLYGYTEIIKSDGTPAQEGEAGELVVTGFHNLAMPFIRYRTRDIAVNAGKHNGIAKITKLQGREQDYLVSYAGEKIDPCPLSWANDHKIYINIKQWQLIQTQPGLIDVKIIKSPEYTKNDEIAITKCFKSAAGLDISIEYVDIIPLTNAGKQKFIIQNIAL